MTSNRFLNLVNNNDNNYVYLDRHKIKDNQVDNRTVSPFSNSVDWLTNFHPIFRCIRVSGEKFYIYLHLWTKNNNKLCVNKPRWMKPSLVLLWTPQTERIPKFVGLSTPANITTTASTNRSDGRIQRRMKLRWTSQKCQFLLQRSSVEQWNAEKWLDQLGKLYRSNITRQYRKTQLIDDMVGEDNKQDFRNTLVLGSIVESVL